jgi:hypothetical protein
MIVADPGILSTEWMLIGKEVNRPYGGRLDLLAIAPDASLVLIELKRNRTPRDIIAQALDYASWVEKLAAHEIAQIFRDFSNGGNLGDAFKKRFGTDLVDSTLNQSHQIVLVASELDNATERIIQYLSKREIAINVLFFQVFQHGAEQFLSRAWLIDPGETQANVATTTKSIGKKEPWNGEFYVSFGEGATRSWKEAREYGFICAGGGEWYSRTLKLLSPGDRIWVNVPQIGYVGVGRVIGAAQPASTFTLKTLDGIDKSALGVLQLGIYGRDQSDDEEAGEWFVPIKWLQTVPIEEAVSEVGFFGNQNTVCQPTTPKWRRTVERLQNSFRNWTAPA